jgi:hypothetical protein
MDAEAFSKLPALAPNVKTEILELQMLLCNPPRPVAVRVKQGFRGLPQQFWSVAEFCALASQNVDVEAVPARSVQQFFMHLLVQVLERTGVLRRVPALQGGDVLTLLLSDKPATSEAAANALDQAEDAEAAAFW